MSDRPDDKKELIKMFMDTFRWEQNYYHRSRFDPGSPIGNKRYNRYENGRKVYYTPQQFKSMVIDYAKTLGVQL